MAKKCKKKSHRGRLQAQGKTLEESEKWSRETPLSGKKALALLSDLKLKIPPAELNIRLGVFAQAEKDINRCMAAKGVSAQYPKSYVVIGTRHERVDIEVLAGRAFV
ncbi:hypothetical protein [Enterobacter asburiae]|uniref:hypothetical protein n=1 Tax=Enterobacter asburiae TaxID=61645 RepID=UPI002074CC5B|nr:hypothetical protein [Enterobacter asburiae]MCM7565672.1 hypothetical protein [Enterobacter asburiae]